MNIAELDKNFKVEAEINKDGMKFYDVENEPFAVYGVYKEDGRYRRMPEAVAATVSKGVLGLHDRTAGGRVRFMTDSAKISIIAKMPFVNKSPHFALTGTAGFDLYEKTEEGYNYIKTFRPSNDITDGYESEIVVDKKMRDITINFPLYSAVEQLLVGIEEDATLAAAPRYSHEGIVYYGSSITQGGCASRPGTCYQGFISRRFDADYLNLGFSGNARAEDEIIDYVKNLEMSMFVYDYDHNAPTVEHLENTHEKMFKAVRAAHPDIPIIMMARPRFVLNADGAARLAVIRKTYENAKAAGDQKVWMLDGKQLMVYAQNEGLVDGTHPTDLGFASMAKVLGDLMEEILANE